MNNDSFSDECQNRSIWDIDNSKMNNDKFGDECQKLVSNYFIQRYNAFTLDKGTNGYDLTVYYSTEFILHKKLLIEIKGISQLYKKTRINRFKFDLKYLKTDLTHFAFIIQDSKLIPKPLMFLIKAKDIYELIKRKTKPTSQYFSFPLRWLVKNYTPIYYEHLINKTGDE